MSCSLCSENGGHFKPKYGGHFDRFFQPTPEAGEWESAGKVVLGGCIINEKSPDWACTNCKVEYIKVK